MFRAKGTTPKALQINLQEAGIAGESSFRVLYYGDASAGSVPFMWESQPGTPKHPSTESSLLPPLTPPPSYHHSGGKYNSSMPLVKSHHQLTTSKRSCFFRTNFLTSLRKPHVEAVAATSFSSSSVSSSSSYSNSSPSTPMSKRRGKTEFLQTRSEDDGYEEQIGGGGSPTSTLCFGGGPMKVYRMKKVKNALLSSIGHGNA